MSTCKETAVFNVYELKTEKTEISLFLPEYLTFCHVEVGQERRNVLRFVNISGLWLTCSDVLCFCFFSFHLDKEEATRCGEVSGSQSHRV